VFNLLFLLISLVLLFL